VAQVYTIQRYASLVYTVIHCVFVHPSQVGSFTKMAEPRITQTTPYDSPGTLVCRCQRSRRNANWDPQI